MPRGFLKMIVAVDFLVHPAREIAVVGPMEDADTQALLRIARETYLPNHIFACYDPATDEANRVQERIPLLRSKGLVDGRPAAYVCTNYACKQPVTTAEALIEQLDTR